MQKLAGQTPRSNGSYYDPPDHASVMAYGKHESETDSEKAKGRRSGREVKKVGGPVRGTQLWMYAIVSCETHVARLHAVRGA
jgi:hypothetical protein